MPIIVDTNVLLVASSLYPEASLECIEACNNVLMGIKEGHQKLVLDNMGLIISEYGNQLSNNGSRVGDLFLRWLFSNQYVTDYCDQVPITPTHDHTGDSFEEFPKDARLASFDPSDRKFVAVALAHPDHPPILNATDSDWNPVSGILATHDVTVESLCPELFL
jgi:hypothetical protein